MSVRSRSLKIALSLTLVGIGVVAGSGEALAGTDGQHVHIRNDRTSDDLKGGWIKGTNWAGQHVQQWVGLTWNDYGVYEWGDSDWWWKGTINIDWVRNDGRSSYAGTTTCQVPTDQGSNDWSYCVRR